MYGWRTDTTIKVVTIFNASYELPMAVVVRELEKYGKVNDIKANKMVDFGDCLDGTITAWVEMEQGKVIPGWIHREECE